MNRYLLEGWTKFTRIFMAGLLAVLPLVLTAGIVGWVASFLRNVMGPDTSIGRFLQMLGLNLDANSHGLAAYALGIVVVVAAIFGLGILFEFGAKRVYQAALDLLIKKIPIVGSLYGSLRQLVGLFDKSKETEFKAMSVVYCYFGKEGGVGVLALMPSPAPIEIEGQSFHVVIIPTAPIPFGGGLVFFPAELVRPVEMTVDNFVSIYVSMGVTTPEFFTKEALSKDSGTKDSGTKVSGTKVSGSKDSGSKVSGSKVSGSKDLRFKDSGSKDSGF